MKQRVRLSCQHATTMTIACFILCLSEVLFGAADADRSTADSLNLIAVPGIVVKSHLLPLTAGEIPAAVSIAFPEMETIVRYGSLGQFAGSLTGVRTYVTGNPWGESSVDVRGFYAGGQTEYLQTSLNGIPLNDPASGRVNWSGIDISTIGRVEAVRGPVSAESGDFGIGGRLALFTDNQTANAIEATVIGSANDGYGASLNLDRRLSMGGLVLSVARRTHQGWRQHSEYANTNVQASLSYDVGDDSRATMTVLFASTFEEHPGALLESELDDDRTRPAKTLFGQTWPDESDGYWWLGGLSADMRLSSLYRLEPRAYVRFSSSENTVTTTHSMTHEPEVLSGGGNVSVIGSCRIMGRSLALRAGIELELGSITTSYRELTHAGNGHLISSGEGARAYVSGYLMSAYQITDRLLLSGSLRIDHFHTDFGYDRSLTTPATDEVSQEGSRFTPKLAATCRFGDFITGYGSVSGAFKTPTLVHLYDSPPFAVIDQTGQVQQYLLISNSALRPMKGIHYELGLRLADYCGVSASAAVYVFDIRDEIDFDRATISYVNIGESRHSGLELTVSKVIHNLLKLEVGAEYIAARIAAGVYNGNQLNGVPEWSYGLSAQLQAHKYLQLGFRATGISNQFLDEANTRALDSYSILSASATLSWSKLKLTVDVKNLLDTEYEYDGYLDPLASGAARFYPGIGRYATLGLSASF